MVATSNDDDDNQKKHSPGLKISEELNSKQNRNASKDHESNQISSAKKKRGRPRKGVQGGSGGSNRRTKNRLNTSNAAPKRGRKRKAGEDQANNGDNSQKSGESSGPWTTRSRQQKHSTENWNQMFVKLAAWKHKHGDTFLLLTENDDADDDEQERSSGQDEDDEERRDLAAWAHYQRGGRVREKLSEEQRSALDAIGFVWNVREERYERTWQQRYQELKEYKEQHDGDTNVPTQNHPLSCWVNHQRAAYAHQLGLETRNWNEKWKKNPPAITEEHKKLLDDIGFVWVGKPTVGWNARFEQLKEYKLRFGNCKVPQHWAENRGLGKWVAANRANYNAMQQGKKQAMITPERLEQLEKLGFDWGKARPNARKK